MTVGILSWNTRNYGLTSLQGWLLVNLYWQTNAHLRCWVGTNKLAKQCDVASATLDKALDWLVEHSAVIKVPFDKRHNEEKKLHQRKTVYQLTGVIKINDEWKRYIEVANPETMYTIATLIGEINFSLAEILRAEFSIAKILTGENEGNKELEGNPESRQGHTRKTKTRTSRPVTPKDKTDSPNGAVAKPNPFFEAISKAFNIPIDAGMIKQYAAFLAGTATKGDWKTYRVEPGMNAEDVTQFGVWYKSTYPKLSPPSKPMTIQKYIYEWRTKQSSVTIVRDPNGSPLTRIVYNK